jgi:flagellar biosynthesis/type III secretory pathway M-ring protein FliF/YscJ
MVILWVAGMGMAGVNKFDLAEMWWITITILLWVVAIAVSWFLIRPAVNETSEDARKKMSAGVGVTHLILVVSLWLMIFKPFVDGTYILND